MHQGRITDTIMQGKPVKEKSAELSNNTDVEICIFHQTNVRVETAGPLNAFPADNASAADEHGPAEQHTAYESKSGT